MQSPVIRGLTNRLACTTGHVSQTQTNAAMVFVHHTSTTANVAGGYSVVPFYEGGAAVKTLPSPWAFGRASFTLKAIQKAATGEPTLGI